MRVVILTRRTPSHNGRVNSPEPEDLDALLAELAEGPDLSDLIAELNTSTEALLEDLGSPDLPDFQDPQ